jgi:hypothetical protein
MKLDHFVNFFAAKWIYNTEPWCAKLIDDLQ